MRERASQKVRRAEHIRLNEEQRVLDRTIDVGFGREVHDAIGRVALIERLHGGAVPDIGLFKEVATAFLERIEQTQVGRIGQGIHIDHAIAARFDQRAHDMSADEAGAPRDQDRFHAGRGLSSDGRRSL